MILSTFFQATETAALALYGDFKFKPYRHLGFQLDAATTFACHILRSVYNLAAVAWRAVITPFYVLNPFAWLAFPDHIMNLIDDVVASVISLVTVAIHPVIFVLRTLSSIVFGYEQNNDRDVGNASDDEADWSLATKIW